MTEQRLDRMLSLAAIPEFAELHPDDLASLAQRAQREPDAQEEPDARSEAEAQSETASRDEAREGADGAALWLLLEGRLEVSPPPRGFEAPALVGAVEALAGAPLSLRARGDGARVAAIRREDLDWVMADVFEVWLAMLRHTASRLVAAEPEEVDPARVQRLLADRDGTSLVTRIRLLQSCELLEGLRVHTLGRIAVEMEELRLAAGEALWEADAPASQCYVVVDGSFTSESGSGEEQVVSREPGAVLGLRRALANLDHPRRMVASAPSRVLRFARETLIDELEDDPDTAAALLEALARRTLRAEGAQQEKTTT